LNSNFKIFTPQKLAPNSTKTDRNPSHPPPSSSACAPDMQRRRKGRRER
jgi:hypothetical protein